MTPYVFVYGTLKPHYRNDHVAQQAGAHTVVGNATLSGFALYDLMPEHYPAIIAGEGVVHGVVLHYPQTEYALTVLDPLEGTHLTPPLYYSQEVDVSLVSGEVLTCWVYIFNRPERLEQAGATLVPSGWWVE